ncbi:MAG: tetratricopeptide repeat protein [Gemmatimonadetes bacterium]|nr:tetratricopeptide repeat protein [Gemmatimonadota bacterium]
MHSTYAVLFRRTITALMTIWLGACQAPESPTPNPERDRLRTLGHTYFRQARYRDALAAYQQAVVLDSLSAEAHCHLATAYMKLGRRDSAETAYLTAIRLDSSLVLAYHNLAVAYGEMKRHREAIALLEEAVRIDPGTAPSYRLLAGLHQEQGAYDRAEEALVRAVAADSTDAETLWALGRLLRMQGRRAESEELLTRAVRFDPDNKEAHRELGVLYTYPERYEEAEGMLRQALEIDPAYPEAYYSLANLYSAQGRGEQAQILLDRFAELNQRADQVQAIEKQVNQTGDLDSYLAAGRSYGELGRWEQAIGMYRAVLKRQPEHVRALAGLSHAYLNQGNLDEAVALAHQVIAQAPDQRDACEAHFTIGYVEARGGRLDQARRSFEQALQIDTTFAKAHHALGNVGLLQGRLDQAEQSYKAAILHRPNWVEPRLSLGQFYLRQQAYDQAIAVLEAVERLDATNAKAHYALGKAYELTGQMDAALRAYRLAVAHWRGDTRQLAAIKARMAQLAP